jgi:hypothetical protein
MLFVSSRDAFDAMLEGCFRAFPGHKKVAKKEYVCSMIISRTRRVNAPFRGRDLFSPDSMSTARYFGDGDKYPLNCSVLVPRRLWGRKELSHILVSIRINVRYGADSFDSKCGMSHQRLTEVMDFEEENMRLFEFPVPKAPSNSELPPGWNLNDQRSNSTVAKLFRARLDTDAEVEEMSCFKRVVVVEVEMHLINPERRDPINGASDTFVVGSRVVELKMAEFSTQLIPIQEITAGQATDQRPQMQHLPTLVITPEIQRERRSSRSNGPRNELVYVEYEVDNDIYVIPNQRQKSSSSRYPRSAWSTYYTYQGQ